MSNLRFGRHPVQFRRLEAPVDFRFTPNRRMHYLCVTYDLAAIQPISAETVKVHLVLGYLVKL